MHKELDTYDCAYEISIHSFIHDSSSYQIPKPLVRQFVGHHRSHPLPLLRRRFGFVDEQVDFAVGDL